MAGAPRVAILMGSDSDAEVMTEAVRVLDEFAVPREVRVLSAHRTPAETSEYARGASARGLRVLIAGAGGAAQLAGVLAGHTSLPVLGVPLAATPLGGLDALLATVQMPGGVPVGTLAIGKAGATNAALLAVRILALQDEQLGHALGRYREAMRARVSEKDRALGERLARGE